MSLTKAKRQLWLAKWCAKRFSASKQKLKNP